MQKDLSSPSQILFQIKLLINFSKKAIINLLSRYEKKLIGNVYDKSFALI